MVYSPETPRACRPAFIQSLLLPAAASAEVRLDAQSRRLRNAIVGEHSVAAYSNSREPQPFRMARPHGYHLGDLTSVRAAFERATGISFTWPDDGEGIE